MRIDIETVFAGFIGLLALFVIYILLVMIPFSLYATNECLKQGYPKARTTVTLDSYCIGLGGAVSSEVKKL